MENSEEEIPVGSKRIYLASITGDIIKIKYKKKYKEKFYLPEEVYKEGSEKDSQSYFMLTLRRKIGLDKEEEEFKITEIKKIKYIGFSVPSVS